MNAFDFPPEFRTMHIATNGTTIYVRSGGTAPAVVLLHGYGETGGMWVTCFRASRVKWPCRWRASLEHLRTRIRNKPIAIGHLDQRERLRIEHHRFVNDLSFGQDVG
jgi:pimeloyl-ACP methyl ester carboxylesterase